METIRTPLSLRFILLATISACQPSFSHAQTVEGTDKKEAVEQTTIDATNVVANEGPAVRAGYGPLRPKLELAGDDAGSKLTFSIGAGKAHAKKLDQAGFYRVTRDNFNFKATVPISGDNKETPFTFGDLGNYEKIELGYTIYRSTIGTGERQNADSPSNIQLVNTATLNCATQAAGKYIRGQAPPVSQSLADDFVTLLSSSLPNISRRDVLLGEEVAEGEDDPMGGAGFKEIREDAITACGRPSDDVTFVGKYVGKESAREFYQSVFSPEPILFLGITGTAGQSDMKYIDTVAFAEKTDKTTALAASAFVGLIGADYSWSARAKYAYLREYEDAAAGQICRPSTTVIGTQQCLEGSLSSPTRNKSSIVSFELRKRFEMDFDDGAMPFGIAPQFTYDFDKKDWGVDVPMYVTGNKKGQITGGIRFGYRSDSDELGAGLFVGIPFTIPFD